jgi:hypothetical protein
MGLSARLQNFVENAVRGNIERSQVIRDPLHCFRLVQHSQHVSPVKQRFPFRLGGFLDYVVDSLN